MVNIYNNGYNQQVACSAILGGGPVGVAGGSSRWHSRRVHVGRIEEGQVIGRSATRGVQQAMAA